MIEQNTIWSHQLLKDFKQILFLYRIKLKAPHIEIVDSDSFWGRWDPLYNKIEIARSLILNHPWTTVLSVLKHEMAHMMVSELDRQDSSHHGEHFQKACDRLGLDNDFRGASGDLPRSLIPWNAFDDSPVVMSKIEKLFSLAQSQNQHEATLAMEKAQHLIQKYNLQERNYKTSDYHHLVIATGRKKLHGTLSRVVALLINYYYVEVVFGETYDAHKNESFKTVEILGRKENVAIAEYVYYFLLSTLDQLWLSYKKNNNKHGRLKRSYQLGLLHGFETKLDSMNRSTEPISNKEVTHEKLVGAIVLTHQQQLQDYLRLKYPRLATKTSAAARYDRSSFQRGQNDGQSIVIHKGLHKASSSVIKFLRGSI